MQLPGTFSDRTFLDTIHHESTQLNTSASQTQQQQEPELRAQSDCAKSLSVLTDYETQSKLWPPVPTGRLDDSAQPRQDQKIMHYYLNYPA